jgi:hypothetical protein
MNLPSTGEVIASSYSCVRALFLVPSPAFITEGDQKILNIPRKPVGADSVSSLHPSVGNQFFIDGEFRFMSIIHGLSKVAAYPGARVQSLKEVDLVESPPCLR